VVDDEAGSSVVTTAGEDSGFAGFGSPDVTEGSSAGGEPDID
jgi:hypothetical protein